LTRNVLITGANKSIGYETARRLGAEGYRVWLGARDESRGETATSTLRAQGHDVRFVQIAVEDEASVMAAADRIATDDGRLDALINNAAIPGTYADVLDETVDEIRWVYDVNVFGPIRMIRAFLPLLKASDAANIVNVSSGLGSLQWMSDPQNPFYGANLLGYNSSKSALNAVTVSYAKALAPLGIRVNSANPGYVKTDFNNHQGYRSVEDAAEIIVRLAMATDAGRPTAGFFDDEGTIPW
jgi:NAD(P)-dependent dehydrogenase (short-subunit alcohol dehydrogenase family)